MNQPKSHADGQTLGEAAAESREFADYLEQKERDGWQLRAPVDDDWGFTHQCHPGGLVTAADRLEHNAINAAAGRQHLSI